MTKYQKYTEYNDSDVEWLGQIPKHWTICRIKEKAQIINGYPFDSNKFDLSIGTPLVRIRDINDSRTQVYFKGAIPEEAFIFNSDILIGMDGDFNVCEWKGGKAALNQRVCCVRTKNSKFTKFLYYLLPTRMKILNDLTYFTTVKHLSSIDVLKTVFALPIETEFTQIVDFLDHETAKIDTLIVKQEKLIELLKEKRQAVINQAVTKGLNPNVKMKHSGMEWLGEVPEHWEVCKIQYYAKIESGHTPSKTNEKYWENCTIPWVSLNDSKQLRVVDYISDTKYKISELGLANSSARILPKDTVVFTRDASIGLSAITTKEMAVSQHLIAWLPKKERLSPEFLLLIFYAMEKEFNRYTFGSTIKTIGMDDVSSLIAAFPSLAEQLDIVERCFNQFVIIDKSIEKSLALLEVLKEKRIALISAAVTGKIDVRDWQNPNKNNNQDNMELSA
ncbi:restriction endonuclease subunit S [Acinetobacter calcoaceticus]|uniref:restriction endonuclease subunit S n=1 Tax=Acinetobacter calcoaceticus TaxID=471 RepID=UPI003AF4245D